MLEQRDVLASFVMATISFQRNYDDSRLLSGLLPHTGLLPTTIRCALFMSFKLFLKQCSRDSGHKLTLKALSIFYVHHL